MSQVSKVDYYTATVPNKAGEGAKVLNALKDAGVNLLAFWGWPMARGKEALLEFIPQTSAGFSKAARKAGLQISKKQTAFYICGEDKPGALAEHMTKLGDAGVNVSAAKAIASGEGRYGAAIFVDPADVRKAAKALGL